MESPVCVVVEQYLRARVRAALHGLCASWAAPFVDDRDIQSLAV
jgi:hypothetical protein